MRSKCITSSWRAVLYRCTRLAYVLCAEFFVREAGGKRAHACLALQRK